MSKPLKKTFELLAETRNPVAIDLLVSALDVSEEGVQTLAVEALLQRRPAPGVVELIRRLPSLSSRARALIEKAGLDLGRGLRDCLLSADPALRSNALALVRRCEAFSEAETLIGLLDAPERTNRHEIEAALIDLVNRLYEHLKYGKESEDTALYLRDSDRIRHQMLAVLEAAAGNYPVHRSRQVVEALLILSDPENMHLTRFLRDASCEARAAAAELLCSSRHEGVMNLVLESMTQNYPFPGAVSALERRTDPEFICHLLRHWPRKPSVFQQKNFKDLHTVAWLDPQGPHLDAVPPALHRTLIAFLVASGLAQPQKLAVLEWMVRFGSPEGRLAATDVLVDLEADSVQDVVLESLESDEPDVQAWATTQLRSWSVPHAMELLIERLDSPIAEVRDAARSELAGFNILRAIELFDQLEPRLQVAVGNLVQKIDPDTIPKLREQIQHPIRRKRIRAARAALAMKLHHQVVDALLVMSRDTDNLARRTAAEVLGKVATPEAVTTLRDLTHDASPRVREAATAALAEAERTLNPRPAAVENGGIDRPARLEAAP
jgi:HEAT repeat protein